MEETSRCGILGWYWSCNSKRINILWDTIECNYLSRNTSSLLYSKSCQIEDWRSLIWESIHVSSTTTEDLITTRSRLDQRKVQLGSTVEQQPVGKLVQQSFGEVQHSTFSQLTQPIPNQSVIDQGNLITRKACLLLKVKRPVLKRSMWNLFTKKSVLRIDQGNLISRKDVIGVQTCQSEEKECRSWTNSW